jgi:hypothetical protein
MKTLSTIAALVLGVGITGVWNSYKDYEAASLAKAEYQTRIDARATDWFVVRKVDVADSPEGTDPALIYDREIRKPFEGKWIVEIIRISDKFKICSNDGSNMYEPKYNLPDAGVTLSWFIRKDCKLPKGQYVAQTYWTIKPEGFPEKKMRVVSNIFEVN